ncbi:MAG: glycosyltransferase [Lentisphaeria bacterium]
MERHTTKDFPFSTKADLHIHSKHSDRPSEWVLRRIGSAECYTEPLDVYHNAKRAGMNFVTITDHNKIDGALEIAHLPGTFLSTEITTYFPDNGAKVHILALGITEDQFKDIEKARNDIYELRELLIEQDIIYSVAHPLFSPNNLMTVEQVEKLLLLFNRFELINGARASRAALLFQTLVEQLDEELLHTLSEKHNILPCGDYPVRKMFTGGSDDHSGRYAACAYTVTPEADTVENFLEYLRNGNHEPAGTAGDSIHMAHSLYHIAYDFYRNRFMTSPGSPAEGGLWGGLFDRILSEPIIEETKSRSFSGRLKKRLRGYALKRQKKQLSETEQLLIEEMTNLFSSSNDGSSAQNTARTPATFTFETSCRLVHNISYAFGNRFIEKISSGELMKSLEAFAALAPVAAAISPYLTAFRTQHQDHAFLQELAEQYDINSFPSASSPAAWLTDTITDVNGVAHTVKTIAGRAYKRNIPMEVLSCVSKPPETGNFMLKNFKAVGEFSIPEYPSQKIAFPPFLEIIEYIERRDVNEIIVSTPGPMGFTGLAAAKLLNLHSVGIYHTDFPNYVTTLTGDHSMGELTARFTYWFFNQFDVVLAPSEFYRQELINNGFSPDKVKIMRRGIELSNFGPDKKEQEFWHRFGGNGDTTFLYVGRVSTEKNIDWLIDAFAKVASSGNPGIQLAVVGDGPQMKDIEKRKDGVPSLITTGYLQGEELAAAYASADIFVFPSTTDTFGNAVLEAQASGLPAIVSDCGGPQEIVKRNNSGLSLSLHSDNGSVDKLADAMQQLLDDKELYRNFSHRALEMAKLADWDEVLDEMTATFARQVPGRQKKS